MLANWKVKPFRSKKYRLFVASHPCCMPDCGSTYGVIPHHAATGGLSTKAGDDKCVPLCFYCHEKMNHRRKDDIPGLQAILAGLLEHYKKLKP